MHVCTCMCVCVYWKITVARPRAPRPLTGEMSALFLRTALSGIHNLRFLFSFQSQYNRCNERPARRTNASVCFSRIRHRARPDRVADVYTVRKQREHKCVIGIEHIEYNCDGDYKSGLSHKCERNGYILYFASRMHLNRNIVTLVRKNHINDSGHFRNQISNPVSTLIYNACKTGINSFSSTRARRKSVYTGSYFTRVEPGRFSYYVTRRLKS